MPDLRISTFDDLLRAARQQPEPQRLLFVFAGVELPDGARPSKSDDLALAAAARWSR